MPRMPLRWVVAMAVALAAASLPVAAQETTGDVVAVVSSQDGLPLPGVALLLEDRDHGLRFAATADRDGRASFIALPVGDYRLTASMTAFSTVTTVVRVELGQTTVARLVLPVGPVTDTIEVTGSAALIDTATTVTGITAEAGELARRLPLSRDVTQVALLAPATVPADARFENGAVWEYGTSSTRYYTPGQSLTAIGGASPAENLYLVNGLNTTNVMLGLGSTFVPMDFVEEIQVKTGGYEAEFGRSTGGVINLVTKSGTNTLRGGASLYWEPRALQSQQPDTLTTDDQGQVWVASHNQDEERELLEANLSLGGAIIRDRLFAFGFLRWIDSDQLEILSNLAQRSSYGQPDWGLKLDWNLSSRHRLEGTVLSDATEVGITNSFFDPTTRELGSTIATGTRSRGGDNAILRYTGLLSDRALLSAQIGRNQFDGTDRSSREDECPYAWDGRTGTLQYVGCWLFIWRGTLEGTRDAARLDGDLLLGRHSLRAGLDAERSDSPIFVEHSGGIYYRYYRNGTDVYFPDVPLGDDLVRVRYFLVKGTPGVASESAYAQDSWALTPSLTLNAGLRWERDRVTNAAGADFLEISDQLAPRLGVIWDPGGEGRAKLYASYGTYHVSMNTGLLINNQAGDWVWTYSWFPLEGGILPDGTPEAIGEQIGDTLVIANGGVRDPRVYADSRIDPMSQDEVIVGFERAIGKSWSVGARYLQRWFNEVIEDIDISRALWEVYGYEPCSPENFGRDARCQFLVNLRLTNPGTDFTGWIDTDGDLAPDREVSFTAEELRIPDPARYYRAFELTVERRFDNRWMLQGSYTWSHLEGNYGGLVNSDFGQDWPNTNIEFDLAGEMEHSRGDLPDDRRHSLKLFGSYLWDFGLSLGGSLWYASGRPINGFGMHPTDPWTQASAWAPYNGPFSFYNNGEACPRGCGGRTPETWALDLTARYDFRVVGADTYVRLDVFNLLDNDGITKVEEVVEERTLVANPDYLEPRFFQAPRTIRIGIGAAF